MALQMFMHKLFQITSSNVNYTYAYIRFHILTSSSFLLSVYRDAFLDSHNMKQVFQLVWCINLVQLPLLKFT